MDQKEITNQIRIALNSQSYQGWVAANGTPKQAARKLLRVAVEKKV